MARNGSLQLPHGMGLYRSQGFYKREKSAMSRTLHISKDPLSLRVSLGQHDSRNILLSDYLHRPKFSVPYRTTAFRCHSLSSGGGAIEPAVKAASVLLTKPEALHNTHSKVNLFYSKKSWKWPKTLMFACFVIAMVFLKETVFFRFHGLMQPFPVVYKLGPGVALLVFSLWVLVPLARQGRNLLLNKNDNGWKKSGTYHAMTSYIQPLLLWLGALLVCRALDHVALSTEAGKVVKDRVLNFARSLSTVLAFTYCLSSLIQQAQKLFAVTSDPNDTRNMGFQFAGNAIYSAVWVAAISLFMELLGFSTQKWLTAGGLGTVLITLAGREILTNFLSSVMIHATRPFVRNEWIQATIEGAEVSGVVEHVGWWSPTIIRGEDREAIHIPNHKFTVTVVRNLTQKTHWRVKTHLAISHLDVNKINNIVADMRKVLAKNPQVEQRRLHRRVFLENVDPENQSLLILISCFVKTSHHEEYFCVKEGILLDLLSVISHHGARLATPIRTIRRMYTDSDMENTPFGDSMYGNGGVTSRRPLMLIEPSYKINGEDKSKAQNRTSKATAEQENKGSSPKSKETSSSDPKTNVKAGESPVSDSNKTPNETGAKPAMKSSPKDTEPSEAEKPKTNQKPKSLKTNVQDETETEDGPTTVSRSPLEENILLGVALDGSKRTLPIEEQTHSSSMTTDTKELTNARKTRNSTLVADQDQKADQSEASSGASNSVVN